MFHFEKGKKCRCTGGNKNNASKWLKGYQKRKRWDMFCITLDNSARIYV